MLGLELCQNDWLRRSQTIRVACLVHVSRCQTLTLTLDWIKAVYVRRCGLDVEESRLGHLESVTLIEVRHLM